MADNPQINAEELARSIAQLAREREALDSSFGSFTSILSDSINELGRGRNGINEVAKSFRSLNSISQKFKYDQEGISRLSKKEIENNIIRIKQDKSRLALAIEKGHITGNELAEAQGVLGLSDELIIAAEQRLEKEIEITKQMGAYGALVKGISKIPFIGGLVDSKTILDKMYDTADAGGSKFKVLGTGLKATASELGKGFKDPTAALIYLIQAGLKADAQITKLAKSFTQTKTEAAATRDNIAGVARASGDNFITTEKLVESTMKLSQQLGIAQQFSGDLTKEFTTLTGKMGLSEDAAGGLAKLTVATGKNARQITTEALGTAQALESQAGIQLDNKQILEEVGKVSGQLLANFKGNPVAIAAAITQTKLLGTTLEQTKKQSESLLDFQSSIENELKAEVITGQQLNLERARALALSGDQAGVAKELANQNMNFNKFSQMNVLAQKDFAAALGLSADELSDQLLKQQYIGKSRKEVAALAGEEVAQRLEALTAQDKFNNAVEKLQDIFVSLIDGPIGQFLDLLSDMLGFIGKIGSAISTMIPEPLLKILVGAGAGFMVGGPWGALAGGVMAAGSELLKASNTNDMMSNYGERTLVTPNGSYALNNSDTVIAGTNLFRGNDVYSGPKGAINLGGEGIDYDKLAASMSKVKIVTDVTDVVDKTNSKMAMSHLANKRYSS
jgi:hypothetical protein